MSEIRKDPVSRRQVIVASNRYERPNDYDLPPSLCPFCPGNEKETPPPVYILNSEKGWKIRVVPNKYPALSKMPFPPWSKNGIYESMKGAGVHEVVVESRDHEANLENMSDSDIADIFRVFQNRLKEIKRNKNIKYAMIFKNYGKRAGASLKHPHSQIIGMPMLPLRVVNELDGAKIHYAQNSSCVFCDIVKAEIKAKKRIVAENAEFIAIEPYASRFCFETWVLPKKHISHMENTPEKMMGGIGEVLKSALNKIGFSLDGEDYNLLIHTMPLQEAIGDHYHWHIEIMPKLSHMAGFEWGTGFYINMVSAEEAAEILNRRKKYKW